MNGPGVRLSQVPASPVAVRDDREHNRRLRRRLVSEIGRRSAWRFNPGFIVMLVLLGIVVAVPEGVGLRFIIPIIEILRVSDPAAETTGVMPVWSRRPSRT